VIHESPYKVLADILTSPNVGLTHVHLVGDVVVAQAVLNEWFAEHGKAVLTPDDWIDITERVLVVEDAYKLLWLGLRVSGGPSIGPDGLRDLATALSNAASTFNEIYIELRARRG
jgi:hypothetical protein